MRKFNIYNSIVVRCIMFLVIIAFSFAVTSFLDLQARPGSSPIYGEVGDFNGVYDWETDLDLLASSTSYITYTDFRNNVCLVETTINQCITGLGTRKIRFDTAEELYRFSIDVSFEFVYVTPFPAQNVKLNAEKVAFLLSLYYVLGNDIDYSIMNAKTWAPVGYDFRDTSNVLFKNVFTGVFDGQGFTISNLYVGGYDYMIYEDQIDDINSVDIALSPYYSMFTINEGTIKNFGLINPTLELLDTHIDITKTSNLVGYNSPGAIVDHVFVIDTRSNVLDAGIRYRVGTASSSFSAAGIVHNNLGTFSNSYYSSKVVVNGSWINRFTIQPVVFENTGTLLNLVYDSSVYLTTVVIGSTTITVTPPNPALQAGESTTVLKSSASILNTATDLWYFYQQDTYPQLLGLEFVDGYYLIENAIDLVFFSRLIGYITSANGTTYGTASYRLTGDIDMSTVAPGAYKTPSVNFNGRLTGLNPSGSSLQDNYYIYNLHLTVGTIRGTLYYSGLFSVLAAGSVVEHLNINQSSIVLSNTENFYSMIFYVGMVAGRLSGGTIENVQVDVSVHLGTQAIGQTHAGGIVGDGAGIIKKTSFSGSINAGNHIFNSSYNITPRYYIGGVVGSASSNALTLSEVVNNAPITGFSTSSTFNLSSGSTSIVVKMGGVIGFVVNTASINHSFVAISNKANITFGSVINTISLPSTQSIGGVFGEITGSSAPVLEVGGVYKNANYYNEGNIVGTYTPSSATIRAAGIGVINMSVQSEFALFYNHGTYSYNTSSISAPNTTFLYTGGIYNIGNGAVILSRIYNYADFNISNNYYTSINPLYYSSTSASTLIRYSANFGNIKFMNNNGLSTISLAASNPLIVSGITTSNNVNLLNVVNEGNIELVSLNIGANPIYVAGIKNFIPAGRYAKNILNQGNITVANITGTGGIYIGGITNQNLAGDLHVNGVNSATLGIINAINYGNITTSFGLKAQNLFGIKGNSNTFAAGIATLNAGSIQDVANLGNISLHNSSTSGSVSASTSTDIAGRINTYTAGLTAGGVVGVTLSGQARVFDSANSGDVVLISYQYARAGGILATSLFSEASAGGITSGLGLLNTIENSVLSNGLNYGSISALTNIIGTYTNEPNTQNVGTFYSASAQGTNLYFVSSSGTELRPAIFSSAGGIIGYGLCVMTRMINHGTISATDVAGGIVGATYVLGTSSGTVTTVVNINTAIHYGKVKAVPNTSVMSGGTPVDAYLLTIANVSSFYLADNNTFIFPTAYTRLAPRNKRGFGGIFGRLQRGTNGIMTSEGGSFDFIVNADPNIDLIGRLDQVQNFSSSSRFFRFNNAIYYSARFNDTTQLVFTGFYYAESRYVSRTLSGGIYTVTMRAVNVFSFVGITSTLFSSPNTNFTFQTQTNSYTNTGTTYYAYYGAIPVPWITEDPEDSRISNSATQYMYNPAFSMRSNPDLTEYIYYMQPNLLSSRFQVGGQSPRPYGMYVLSTSFGSTFGLVLPANIREENLFLIDEDLVPAASLLSDYDAIPASLLKPIDQVVLDKYFELKQTIYNEKSAYISTENPPLILTESGGSSTILSNGVYNDIAKTVTFTISMEGFLVGQTIANWSVFSITSSANALVAKRINDYYGSPPSQAQLDEYNNLLFSQRFQGIATGSVGATLTTTLPSRSITSNQTISVGYFSIFSEAYINSDLFAHPAYYTDYQVFVTFTPTISNIPTGTIGINTVSFNGGGSILVSNQTDVSSLGDVLYNGSIRFNFLDTKGVWASGYDFKDYISIRYQDGSVVNPMYYSIVSTPVIISGSNRTYSVLITFSNQTKSGNYYMDYRYFPTSPVLSVMFDKAASNIAQITGLNYYSNNGSVSISGTTINSLINLGVVLNIDATNNNFTSTTNTSLPSYLNQTTYNVNFMTNGSFVLSPFATLTQATLVSTTFNNGYKTYRIQYGITAENGTTITYDHYIVERVIDLTAVLKNNNEIDFVDAFATRENLLTVFRVDLGLDQMLDLYQVVPGPYSYFQVFISAVGLNGVTPISPANIFGITFYSTSGEYLYIDMDYQTLPGLYTFSFRFNRDGSTSNFVTLSTSLTIRKNAGTDPYLKDIRFSELANETSYPTIRITDINGVVNNSTGKDLRVFFGGIDYDGANTQGFRFFRVDGQVSNISLDQYVPFMINYLPFGASISRRAWNTATQTWFWTTEVRESSSQSDKNQLIANFTVIPETGAEPTENEEVVILYRVTSEDGLTFTYYYVTVTDINFNVTIVFDIYFCTGVNIGTCTIASQSTAFSNQLVIITVKNLNTNGDSSVINVVNPAFYPTFSIVNSLNNQMTQFYYTFSGNYRYSFGRNISGFYLFDLELPKDRYLNDRYTYTIEHQDFLLNDASLYVPGLLGKYFYIEAGTKNRTRRFNIYIREQTTIQTSAPWGLFDFFRSWAVDE